MLHLTLPHMPRNSIPADLGLAEFRRPECAALSQVEPSGSLATGDDSVTRDPWDGLRASPFWTTLLGRLLIVATVVAGASIFGLATGAVIGTITGGWTSIASSRPGLLTEETLLMALVGGIFGAMMGSRGSDPVGVRQKAMTTASQTDRSDPREGTEVTSRG
ncbi:MAG: hypothetical protein IT428_28365 [Planctomycetaceae bacterium]|nr:hypothetical protein [Planctomycetaceae bacterium]